MTENDPVTYVYCDLRFNNDDFSKGSLKNACIYNRKKISGKKDA